MSSSETEPLAGNGGSGGDDGLRQFLNTTGDSGAGFKLVNAANPLQWGKFATTIVGSLIGGLVVGVQYSLDALFGAPASLLTGFADWVSREARFARYAWNPIQLQEAGLIATIESGLSDVISEAWSPLNGMGWLAYPVAVVELLAVLYVVFWAVSYVREEVL